MLDHVFNMTSSDILLASSYFHEQLMNIRIVKIFLSTYIISIKLFHRG